MKIRRFIRDEIIRRYPAGAMLASISVPAVFLVPFPDFPFGAGVLISCLATLAVWYPAGTKNALYRFALPAFIMLVSIYWMRGEEKRNELSQFLGNTSRARINAVFQVVDHSCGEPLGNPRKMVCKVLSLKWPGAEESFTFASPPSAAVDFKDGTEAPVFGYGDIFEAEGVISQTGKPLLESEFDYALYLERRGIRHLFRGDSIHLKQSGKGFLRTLFDLRGKMLARVTDKLENDNTKALACGLFFGMRQDITPETKQAFLRSGAVHILTVSGTHVAIVLALALALLRFIPFRTRTALALAAAGIYALSTGMEPPACRAFVMAVSVLGLRAFLYRTDTLNTLFLAAFILLIFDPANLVSAGFQFSFVTVGALVVASDRIKLFAQEINPSELWLAAKYTPTSKIRYIIFRNKYLAGTTGACLTAFAASLPIGMYYQNLIPAGAVAANIILIPAASTAFALFFGALAVSSIPFIGSLAIHALDAVLTFMLKTCDAFADTALTHFAEIPLWCVILFTALLFCVISQVTWKRRTLAASLMAAIMVFTLFRGDFADREELAMTGGGTSQIPCVVITEPETSSAYIVNIPDFATAKSLESFLVSRGVSRCVIFISGGTKNHFGGVEYFTLPISRFIAKKSVIRKVGLEETENTLEIGNEYSDGRLKIHSQGDMFQT